jgi:hypothetical protein
VQSNQGIQPIVEAVYALAAYHNMLTDVLTAFPDALDKLNNGSVTGARIQMIDVTAEGYSERKCVVTVYTAQEAPATKSTVIISELYDSQDAVAPEHLSTHAFDNVDMPDVCMTDVLDCFNSTTLDT